MDRAGTEPVYRGDIGRLEAKIASATGLDLTQYRPAYVERRIATRLRSLNLHTYRQYARRLDEEPGEYAKLVDTLTINVTDFFRDPPVFDAIRSQVVPEIIAAKRQSRHRVIRVWSAGCATGEEPYSLTMAFLDALGATEHGFMLTVVGTDLDPRAIDVAKRAEYDVAKLHHIPKADQARFVDKAADRFRIKPEVTKHVRFQRLNLFTDEPIHAVDMILCRNVFIYFTREQQARLLAVFTSALARNGFLVLGRSEKLAVSISDSFDLVSGRDRIYRKK